MAHGMNTDEANSFMDDACNVQVGDDRHFPGPTHSPGVMAENNDVLGAKKAAKRVLKQAATDRRPPPPMHTVPVDHEPSGGALVEVLGIDNPRGGDGFYGSQDASDFPMVRKLYSVFASSAPKPKVVRLDTEASYNDFVSKKDFLELDRRMNELRQAVEAHTSDKHGGAANLRPWDQILGEADHVAKLQASAKGGSVIPLSLPPWAEGKVIPWQEGDLICCSVRLPGPDGEPRIATTTTSVDEHAADVVGYVARSGVDPVQVMSVLPHLTRMLGAGSLVPQLAQVAPSLLADPEATCVGDKPMFRKMVPSTDPTSASLMALCQMVQSGNPQARAEWDHLTALAHEEGGEPLGQALLDAANRLSAAQALKAATGKKNLLGSNVMPSSLVGSNVMPSSLLGSMVMKTSVIGSKVMNTVLGAPMGLFQGVKQLLAPTSNQGGMKQVPAGAKCNYVEFINPDTVYLYGVVDGVVQPLDLPGDVGVLKVKLGKNSRSGPFKTTNLAWYPSGEGYTIDKPEEVKVDGQVYSKVEVLKVTVTSDAGHKTVGHPKYDKYY